MYRLPRCFNLSAALVIAAGLVCGFSAPAALGEPGDDESPDVVYVPTPSDVVAKMLDLAKIKKTDLVYDLGCGDGRIVVTAARKYGCHGIGFDINPVRIKESLANVKKYKVEELVKIEKKNIFNLDLSKVNVVTLYLLPELNLKLVPQFEKLKPGSRIVSHNYGMKGYKPDKTVYITSREDNVSHTVYLWTTPLKKSKDAADDDDDE